MAHARQNTPSRRVVIVAPDANMLVERRGPLLRAITAAGHQLLCVTAPAADATQKSLKNLGAEHAAVTWNADKLTVLGDRATAAALQTMLAGWQPTVALTIGLKPSVLVGRMRRRIDLARQVAILPSAGTLDDQPALGARWLARRSLKSIDAAIVYSSEAREVLATSVGLAPTCPITVMPGAGIDLAAISATPLPDLEEGLVFTMVAPAARRDGGIAEFCAAAQRVKTKAPRARFILALGSQPADSKGSAVSADELAAFSGSVEIVQLPIDRRALLAATHVVVQPSLRATFCHEVAEALAAGRPAITTTIPGCRDLVDERVSGVLVPPGDAVALAAAMESFLRRPDLIPWMAQASRLKAERRFDCIAVNVALMRQMDLNPQGNG